MTHGTTTRTRVLLMAQLAVFALLASNSQAQAQRLDDDWLTDGSRFKAAFRAVVAEPSRSTVRVLSRGKQVALGVVVDARGYILTKASELKGRLTCALQDGRKLDAEIVGLVDDYDLAMLKVPAEDLVPILWREGSDPHVGQWLATPDARELPVAVGVVSVGRRKIPMPRAILGVTIADDPSGARITHIFPESGADKAGLKPGDVVTWVAGTTVRDAAGLSQAIRRFHPGAEIELHIRRPDAERSVALRARLGSPHSDPNSRGYIQNHMGGDLSERRHGFPAVLQHDTVLRPEECGGPVVDLRGRAIGLNIARAGRVETYALPADKILSLLDELKAGKHAPPPQLVEIEAPREPASMN